MNNCSIVKDLIPMYVEGLTSEDTSNFIKQHIDSCKNCRDYYENIKNDFESKNVSPDVEKDMNTIAEKLSKYQNRLKLLSVFTAMLMSCIIAGAGVEFLSTIPFLILTPFVCRLFYNKSLPIIISSIPFGIIGGALSTNNSSFIPTFTVLSLLAALAGTLSGMLIKGSFNNNANLKSSKIIKPLSFILAIVIMIFSCNINLGLTGNPIGYIIESAKIKKYVNAEYKKDTLYFKGIGYNFKDQHYYGKYEHYLNGVRQTASIEILGNGSVSDRYKYELDETFCSERSEDMKAQIASSLKYIPFTVYSESKDKLNITQDETNNRFYYLSYDKAAQNEAEKLRKSETLKLNFEISFGKFKGDYDTIIDKEDFIAKSKAIYDVLKQYDFPFGSVTIKSKCDNDNYQIITFTKSSTENEMLESYKTEKANVK